MNFFKKPKNNTPSVESSEKNSPVMHYNIFNFLFVNLAVPAVGELDDNEDITEIKNDF